MTLTEQHKKLLARIACDSPARGDGQEFMKLLYFMEIDALKSSKCQDSVMSRQYQGQAMAYETLQKQFTEAKNS